jgi:hypothetical protein
MAPARAKWVRLVSAIAIGAVVVASLALWQAWKSARSQLAESRCDGHATFVQSQWLDTALVTGKLAIRGCMVDDLLERYDLRGKTRDEVVALIGDAPRSDLFPEYDMVYWLGPQRGLIGTDSEFLVLKLGTDRRVTAVELLTG